MIRWICEMLSDIRYEIEPMKMQNQAMWLHKDQKSAHQVIKEIV